jgi:hypothetical protein
MNRSLKTPNVCAPVSGGPISICPHCWGVNVLAERLCGRCGADMHLLLQESGGARATAPVQSPVPVRARQRLSPLQRALVLCFVLLLAAAHLIGALYLGSRRGAGAHPGGAAPPIFPLVPAYPPSSR